MARRGQLRAASDGCEKFFDERSVLGGIDAEAGALREEDADAGTVFEGAELFELFALFERRKGTPS